ncbi:MAG: metallophosphoesterase family protein [Myxococcales bacterium]|nr:metallophosphoesterase family protein [Myxococcales bacterium]
MAVRHLLHLTDTHLGLKRRVRRAQDRTARSDLLQADAFEAFRRALLPALRGEVDLVVHTGDLFDRSRPPRAEVVRTCELLLEVARRVPVVVMPGNHDRRGLQRWLPHGGRDLHVLDRPCRVEVAGVALGVVPFERTAAGFGVAAHLAVGPGVDFLLAHQAFDGHQVPGHTFRAAHRTDTVCAEHLPAGAPFVLCGHLHPRQVVQVGETSVVCPGSTVRTSLSERSQTKGAALWTLGAEVRWRWLELPSRPMHLVREASDLSAVAPGDLVRAADETLSQAALARGGWLLGGGSARPRPPEPEDGADQLALPLS